MTGFGGKQGFGWRLLARWAVPLMMTVAYVVLMLTSDTDASGKAWMAIGLGFVFVVWFVFRLVTERAALSRAVAVGDSDRLIELTEKLLAGKRGDAARAELLVFRAMALELRGDWPGALAALEQAKLEALPSRTRSEMQLVAAGLRVAAYVETKQLALAQRTLDEDVAPIAGKLHPRLHAPAHAHANLAKGRVLAATGAYEEAAPILQLVIDEVRAGSSQRAVAHFYAARCSTARGDTAGAERHRAKASQLLPGSWITKSV